MSIYIRDFLEEVKYAVQCVKDYKCSDNSLRLLTAGEHRSKAYRYLFQAKDFISESEWEVWSEIYWDFYHDLSDLVLE